MATAAYYAWVAAGRPNNGPIRPLKMLRDRLRRYGYTVYDLGDTSHQTHNPPEDHTCFSASGWPVTAQRWWIHAIDIMPPPPGKGLPSLQRLGAQMLADKKAGIFHPLKYMNWEPERDWGGACYQERFMPDYQRRTSSDRGHIHLSGRSDMVAYTGADNYDPVARLRGESTTTSTPGDDDMPLLFFAKLANDPTVRLVDSFMTNRAVTADEFPVLKQALGDNKVGTTVWEWPNDAAHKKLFGVNIDSLDDVPEPLMVTLSADQLADLGVQVRQGVPSLDQIRGVVDEELDEQSRGGADVDAP